MHEHNQTDTAVFVARDSEGHEYLIERVEATLTQRVHFRTVQGFVVVEVSPDVFDILSGPKLVRVTAGRAAEPLRQAFGKEHSSNLPVVQAEAKMRTSSDDSAFNRNATSAG